MNSQGHEPTDLIRSVSRALRIIEEVSGSPHALPVKVIARRCQINLSTAYHLIRTLCYEGYLVRLPDGGYVAGSKVAERFHDLMSSLRGPTEARTVSPRTSAAHSASTLSAARSTPSRAAWSSSWHSETAPRNSAVHYPR